MTLKDILWIAVMGIGSGVAGLFAVEVTRLWASSRARKENNRVAGAGENT